MGDCFVVPPSQSENVGIHKSTQTSCFSWKLEALIMLGLCPCRKQVFSDPWGSWSEETSQLSSTKVLLVIYRSPPHPAPWPCVIMALASHTKRTTGVMTTCEHWFKFLFSDNRNDGCKEAYVKVEGQSKCPQHVLKVHKLTCIVWKFILLLTNKAQPLD